MEIDLSKLPEIPLRQRTNMRSLARGLNTSTSTVFRLLPEETEPHRTCQSKRYIKKVMLLAAVARPRFDLFGNEVFDGKIGIFPFVVKEAAKRSSKNRPAGTLEDKREAAKEGFDIRLRFQPSQSPDMNVLDLGFFRAIQSLQHEEAPTTVGELLLAVNTAFEKLSSQSLNAVFLTLQLCMVEVLKVHGEINNKLKHIGKRRLARMGELPTQIEVNKDLVMEATHYHSCLSFFCDDKKNTTGGTQGTDVIMSN